MRGGKGKESYVDYPRRPCSLCSSRERGERIDGASKKGGRERRKGKGDRVRKNTKKEEGIALDLGTPHPISRLTEKREAASEKKGKKKEREMRGTNLLLVAPNP